jgi:hypothetical protein
VNQFPGLLPLVIGVTGHRDPLSAAIPDIERAVGDVFTRLKRPVDRKFLEARDRTTADVVRNPSGEKRRKNAGALNLLKPRGRTAAGQRLERNSGSAPYRQASQSAAPTPSSTAAPARM